jgi:type II secretory pathway pseudopilin PulG
MSMWGRAFGPAPIRLPRFPERKQMNRKNRIDCRALLTEQGGWTLMEVLVGMAIMLVVVFAALPILEGATNTQGRIQTSANSIADARAFSDQVLADLRPADRVLFGGSNQVQVQTYVRHNTCGDPTPSPPDAVPIQCDVTYTCSGASPDVSCTRQEEGGPIVTEITGLADDAVFSFRQPGDVPVYARISLDIPNPKDSAQNEITLRDGTALRNVQ